MRKIITLTLVIMGLFIVKGVSGIVNTFGYQDEFFRMGVSVYDGILLIAFMVLSYIFVRFIKHIGV